MIRIFKCNDCGEINSTYRGEHVGLCLRCSSENLTEIVNPYELLELVKEVAEYDYCTRNNLLEAALYNRLKEFDKEFVNMHSSIRCKREED